VYEEHFGLSVRPFSKTPDPRFLYESRGHQEALARMLHAISERELCLLTGEVGAGKTTLSRALIDRLDETHRVCLIINPLLSAAQLLETIALRLFDKALPKSRVKQIDMFTESLYALHCDGRRSLLIIDEAQLIGQKRVFEELRLLTNLQLDDEALLTVLLMGQPELKKKLAQKRYANFAQRIGMAFHLEALDADDTRAYVQHRLHVAGARRPLFSDEALSLVVEGSGGIPRRINTICQNALLVAFGEGQTGVEAADVADVLSDLRAHLGAVFT